MMLSETEIPFFFKIWFRLWCRHSECIAWITYFQRCIFFGWVPHSHDVGRPAVTKKLLIWSYNAFLPTSNLQSSVVVRGSFHLFNVFDPSHLYLMFRISNVRSSSLSAVSVHCISCPSSVGVHLPQIGWEPIQSSDIHAWGKSSIYTWHVLHVHVLTTPHILLENKVAIQSKLFNLGSTGHILPRLSYCDHYVLCCVAFL